MYLDWSEVCHFGAGGMTVASAVFVAAVSTEASSASRPTVCSGIWTLTLTSTFVISHKFKKNCDLVSVEKLLFL